MMSEDTFFRILDTTIISAILCLIFFGIYAVSHIFLFCILGSISMGICVVVWGGALISDMISSALSPNSNSSLIGVITYILLVLITGFLFYERLK